MRIFLYRTCGAYWIFTVYSKWIWCFPLFPFCFKEEPKIFFIKPLILQSVNLLDCQDDYIFGACATDILNLSLLVALKEMMMAPLLIPSGGKTTQKEYFQWAAASGYQSTSKLQRNRVLPVGLLLSCLSGVSWTLMSSFNSKPGSHCHKISSFFSSSVLLMLLAPSLSNTEHLQSAFYWCPVSEVDFTGSSTTSEICHHRELIC